jgi:hypothetical protein
MKLLPCAAQQSIVRRIPKERCLNAYSVCGGVRRRKINSARASRASASSNRNSAVNLFAERLIASIRRDRLDPIMVFNELTSPRCGLRSFRTRRIVRVL